MNNYEVTNTNNIKLEQKVCHLANTITLTINHGYVAAKEHTAELFVSKSVVLI